MTPSAEVAVESVGETSYSKLPLDLFESSGVVKGSPSRAVFTVADRKCGAISGDLRDASGVPFSRRHAVAHAVETYNAAASGRRAPRLSSDQEKIDYAFAVASLFDPDVNGHAKGTLVLLSESRDVEELLGQGPEGCAVTASDRKKAGKALSHRFSAPRLTHGRQDSVVGFFTWSSTDGEVRRNSVRIADDGKVSIDTEVVASHVGLHRDRP